MKTKTKASFEFMGTFYKTEEHMVTAMKRYWDSQVPQDNHVGGGMRCRVIEPVSPPHAGLGDFMAKAVGEWKKSGRPVDEFVKDYVPTQTL